MVIVYHAPSLNNPLLMAFLLVNELPTQHRILIVGNFNLDQMLLKNVAKIASLIQNCNLSQCLQYSTHTHEGILDPVFDSFSSNIVSFYLHPTVITLFVLSKSEEKMWFVLHSWKYLRYIAYSVIMVLLSFSLKENLMKNKLIQ